MAEDYCLKHQFSLDGRPIMMYEQCFSLYLSRALDCLGKSQDMIKLRVGQWRKLEQHMNRLVGFCHETIIAGSKGEGLTMLYENDIDNMFVLEDALCVDVPRKGNFSTDHYVFLTEHQDTKPGYTFLRLIQDQRKRFRYDDYFKSALFQHENGGVYLNSDIFFENLNLEKIFRYGPQNDTRILETIFQERSGPSQPAIYLTGGCQEDHVFSLKCKFPEHLQKFISRKRLYKWPNRKILNEISKLDAHVVPKGYKESNSGFIEWRISFTKAEICLVHSLNDTATKLYILLRMLAKDVIKPICKDITSYVMKNMVFWMVETTPSKLFTEDLLTARLKQALTVLKDCVEKNELFSFMIPERNLLAEIIDPQVKIDITNLLTALIKENGCAVMRCKNLHVTIVNLYKEPIMAEFHRGIREKVEKWFFEIDQLRHNIQINNPLGSEDVICCLLENILSYQKIDKKLRKTIEPDGKSIPPSTYIQRIKNMLSGR